jgi:four helix bundle protein
MENNIILNKSVSFSGEVIRFAREIPVDCRTIASQLVRSGTSIGASIAEAQGAESTIDFVHKLKIADKEARETEYWLNLLSNTERGGDQTKLRVDLREIQRLLNAIIGTCKRKLKKKAG